MPGDSRSRAEESAIVRDRTALAVPSGRNCRSSRNTKSSGGGWPVSLLMKRSEEVVAVTEAACGHPRVEIRALDLSHFV